VLLVVNAQHIKAVPGRKTDVRDAEWIADLLQHGLLRGSFIPPPTPRELRDLTR
jgi:transposase